MDIIREIKVPKSGWKTLGNGDDYYVSPNTGWVYCFYKLTSFNKEYPNTDKICCMCEFSSERELLESGCEGYEIEEIVGWLYGDDNYMPKECFEDMINDYEKEKCGGEGIAYIGTERDRDKLYAQKRGE